jgi:hypothetical protein
MSLEITPTRKQSSPQPTFVIVPVAKPEKPPDYETFLTAMLLMFARAPRNPNPDVDGSFNLGEIGQDAFEDQRLLRDTPYSICRGIRES